MGENEYNGRCRDQQDGKERQLGFKRKEYRMKEVFELNNGQGKMEIVAEKEIVWLTPNVKKVIIRNEYHLIEEN